MNNARTIAISDTVRSYQPGIKELAQRCDCSANLLYRASTPGASGCDLGFGRVERIIDVTRNFAIIDYITNRFGFFKVRPPRIAINRMDRGEVINHFQIVTLAALHALKDFFFAPSQRNRSAVDRHLSDCLSTIEGIRKRIRSSNFSQLELEV